MKTKMIIYITLIALFIGCNKVEHSLCCDIFYDSETIINSDLYLSSPKDEVVINSLEIHEEEVLIINFSASGCDGDTWEVKLIDSEEVSESNPVQRNLVFSLNNDEECDAYITKDLSFDITNLKIEGENQIILNITNTNDVVLYEY